MLQFSSLVVIFFYLTLLSPVVSIRTVSTDILIVGGSLSALASAVTIANVSRSSNDSIRVILLEPTDWAGGQLTASNVPPDFGDENHRVDNLPQSFVTLLNAVAGPDWETNPGLCWVSYKCFQANIAAAYIKGWLDDYFPTLEVYYNTVVKNATYDKSKKRISEVTAIKRNVRNEQAQSGYENLLSTNLHDWYDPDDSAEFTKEVLTFNDFAVIIEASEFSDVISTAHIPYVQGVEVPFEDGVNSLSECGQSTVLPFYMSYSTALAPVPDPVPPGCDGGKSYSFGSLTWNEIWTYRRALGLDTNEMDAVPVQGEHSNQNLDNDYPLGYIFLNDEDTKTELSSQSGWGGGVNLTTLSAVEQRAYGWYHHLVSQAEDHIRPYLTLNVTQVGTKHGLGKVPYLRDTKRIRSGLDGFRLFYRDLNFSNVEDGGQTARLFYDTVGIGDYFYADVHMLQGGDVCGHGYPNYVTTEEHPVKPYYIPFRAMTAEGVNNLLVPGKSMAQSFLANAATRLHPTEWSSGVAAGAAAHLITSHIGDWRNGTIDMLANIEVLQNLLQEPTINSPITWAQV